MILECPACHIQFNVPDGAITAEGRTVKCSKCAHQWHATLPEPKPEPRPAAPAPEIPAAAPPEAPTVPLDASFLEQLARETGAPDESMAAPMPEFEASPAPQPQAAPAATRTSATPPAKSFTFPFPIWPFKLAAPSLALCWLVLATFAYFPGWIDAPVMGAIYRAMGVIPTDGVILADVAMQRQQEGQRTRFLISGNIVNQQAAARKIPSVRVQMLNRENDVVWSREYDVGKTLEPGEIYPFRITNAETSFADSVSQLVVDVGHPLQMMFR